MHRDSTLLRGLHTGKSEIRTFLLAAQMREPSVPRTERFEAARGFSIDQYVQGEFGMERRQAATRWWIDSFDAKGRPSTSHAQGCMRAELAFDRGHGCGA